MGQNETSEGVAGLAARVLGGYEPTREEIQTLAGSALVQREPQRSDLERLAADPAAPALAAAIAMQYARPLAFAQRAMQEFVDKVDRGEARSKRSYAAFKHALGEIVAAFPNLAKTGN